VVGQHEHTCAVGSDRHGVTTMCGVRWAAVLLLAATVTACGGGGGGGGGGPKPDTTPPSTPTGVTATASSSTAIVVAWQASSDGGTGVAGYHVFRDGAANPVATVTATTYTDTGLAAATQYSYAVRAFDAASPANESALSASAAARTLDASVTSGLDTRPSNTTCLAGDRPAQSVSLARTRVFSNLPAFASPLLMLQAPGDATRWFVVEQGGTVRVFDNQDSVTTTRTSIDISSRVQCCGETGLLGMAFHPDFPANPRVYLSYTNANGGVVVSRISEFRSADGGLTLDPTTEVILLTVTQPAYNHNGGNIAFGPDGLLYIGFGDGGSGGDPWGTIGNGQNLTTLLGKLLRIDIGGSTGSVPYRIPAGNLDSSKQLCNTGSGTQTCPEIYAYGFRNPWRWSFDRVSGELWVGDVGQDTIEEVDRVVAGGNYGWRCFEGTQPYNSTCGPNAGSSLPPVAQYVHPTGNSITGGYVYRGSAIPALSGRYVFGDFGSGRIWHIARDTVPTLTVTTGFDSGLSISSFAQDVSGELYMVDYGGGLYRLDNATPSSGSVPDKLSDSGCVQPGDPTRPAAGLVPYAPNVAFWSDGATKNRYVALPDGTSATEGADGDFDLPVGTVLMKEFRLGSRRVETRFLMRHTDGQWAGYTYEWNAQGTDASRVVGGKTATIGTQTWVFPSEAQCLICHTAAAGRTLGLELAQLNGPLLYPQTGRTANQVSTWNAIGYLNPPITGTSDQWPAMPDPFGSLGTIAQRARAYLHANCAQCHRPNGGTPSDMDLRYTTTLASTNTCDWPPQAGDLGIANARIIAPGSAASSVLISRVGRRDAQGMPPLASTMIDSAGVALLTNWVNSLTSCN
jgi:uncharacterized repeat protein (TIGR03806 family)